ncbi:MAG: Gfo/Idh/MocA family oxidoreductase [Clostridia bacterium]|nr:Gfo/Idh/MocA family oxidoreductase [Clostridia bacterium]
MKEMTYIILGAGSRGKNYAKNITLCGGDRAKLVGVAEPLEERREYMRTTYNVPAENCVLDWTELLSRPKMADAVVISMQDRMHYEPAMKAISLGYHLLLEKPMAPTPEECVEIARAAEEKGVHVIVGHVLRYTPFFNALKNLINSGRIGNVMNIIHIEGVGHIHQSHSFVRGNWHVEGESAPMLLAKSCHDIDILQWLVDKQFKRVQSFGSLSHFCPENRPEGAPDRCLDGCPHADDCCYNAKTVYIDLPAKRNSHFRTVAANAVQNPSDERVMQALRETDYGRCVYAMNNDVVDHQTVNIEFEDDVYATFTMSAFNQGGRSIRIMGTKGELSANMKDPEITIYDFATRKTSTVAVSDFSENESITGGHGGGDGGISRAFVELLTENKSSDSISSGIVSAKNHLAVFAAEESRVRGTVVDVKEYESRF